jgi:tetratricopeptide (TPR) repeat protein
MAAMPPIVGRAQESQTVAQQPKAGAQSQTDARAQKMRTEERAEQNAQRHAVLKRDPHDLPRASDDRWKSFGETPIRPEDVPSGILAARDALMANDLPMALQALYTLLDAEPEYPPALHQMGVLYFKLQRYSDAVEVFERFLRQAPQKIGQTRTLGHCYYTLGDYAKAKAHYERVLAVAPDEIEAVRGLALSHMRLGDGAKALELLARVLEAQPDHADAWTWRAHILFDLGRTEEALAAAEKSRDLDPYEPRSWFVLGRVLLELGREDEGLAAHARFNELQEIAQDLRSLESRLEFRPHQLPLLLQVVELHRKSGDVARTRTALAHALSERPTDVRLRILALDVLEDLHDADGARVAAKSLESVGADEASAWQRLELYYARLKDLPNQLRAGERYRRLSSQ